ncbi:MAG: tRNA 2-thiocytidine(32) synthetase TtcA [Myxococcota bacterium]|nr:tRNA 2-thiocytidine(32) synthetase TtcA [Myxococcota bacterium]
MDAPRSPTVRLTRKLTRRMAKVIKTFDLIQPGDRIMVAVSGGKDSYALLDLLWRLRKRSPISFDVVAVHLDQGQPGYDGTPLENWLDAFGAPYEIIRRDTYSVVLELTKPGGTFCAPCARMRRGILYDAAERLGCNKIALGHHRDDALQTLLMNLFFSGKLQAMPAVYRTDDDRFDVIRPLMACAETDLATYATHRAFPILPCNLCGSQSGLQRVRMESLLTTLEAEIPNVREVMLAAIGNVRATHLLDKGLVDRLTNASNSTDGRPDMIEIDGLDESDHDEASLIQIGG